MKFLPELGRAAGRPDWNSRPPVRAERNSRVGYHSRRAARHRSNLLRMNPRAAPNVRNPNNEYISQKS
jgi:hypothetical protein